MGTSRIPVFTIVTPSFNQAEFIHQTIQSVLQQDDPHLQYWIIDGGSTDETPKVLRKYEKELSYVSEKDRGQTHAINKGIRLSRLSEHADGIFAYINSDDYYLPGAFEKVRAAFRAHPEKKWLVGECTIVNERNEQLQPVIQWYKRFLRKYLGWTLLTILNPIPQPAVFIRAEAVNEIGEFTEKLRYVMDYEYWLRLYKQLGPPLLIDQPLAAFRIHEDAKGSMDFPRQFAEELSVAKQYSRNWLALLLHSLHNRLILMVYSVIK